MMPANSGRMTARSSFPPPTTRWPPASRVASAPKRAGGKAACLPACVPMRGVPRFSARRPMSEFRLDRERADRTGTSEAALCAPKSAAQIDAIAAHATELGRRLLTRLGPRKFSRLSPEARDALDYDAATRTAILGGIPAPRHAGRVAIVCGGTSDLAVAREAARPLLFAGESAPLLADVGIARRPVLPRSACAWWG